MYAAVLLAVLMLGGGAAMAWAEEAADPTPTPPPPTLAITSPADGFTPSNQVAISGTKAEDSTVAVTAPGSDGCVAPDTDQPLTTWSCTASLRNGPGLVVTATETLADNTPGGQDSVTISVLGPPSIHTVPPQQAPGVASGTGYPGSAVALLVNDTSQSCNARVTDDGKWLCTIAGGAGTYTVQAIQAAPMGTSNPSGEVTIVVNPAPPIEPPPPVTPPPAPQPAPVLPKPPPAVPEDEAPEPAPSPTPDQRGNAGTVPWLDRPIFPGPDGEGPTIREALTNWGTPTGLGSQIPTPGETVTGGNWLWAPLIALAFIGLIAVPLRLLAGVLRDRFTFGTLQLAGRNRRATPAEEPAPRNPWLMGSVPLAATAGLIVLAEGPGGEVRYLRLLFAVGAGLAILNIVGVAIATRLASHRLGMSRRLRFLPILLVVAAIATLIARFTGMEPPLVGGVLIAAGFAATVPVKPRALVNLSQVGGVLVLALLAWVAHGLVGGVDGFWASVLSETLATICLAGLGSALILMLPIGALPGRVVLEWSRGAWFAATALVGTVTAAILMGGVQPAFPTLATVLIVAGFAAICVAIWAWANYVEVSRA